MYTLIYLMNKDLPWGIYKGLPLEEVVTVKMNTTAEELCVGLPGNQSAWLMIIDHFLFAMEYIFNMDFNSTPKYDMLISIFLQAEVEAKQESFGIQKTIFPRRGSRGFGKKISSSVF